MSTDFPTEGMALTHLLVVRDLERSRAFYRDVLGAEVFREYGGTSVVLSFLGTWLLLVTGGEPTQDKPDVTFAAPVDPRTVSPFDDHPGSGLPRGLRDASSKRCAVPDPTGELRLGGARLLPRPRRAPAGDQRGEDHWMIVAEHRSSPIGSPRRQVHDLLVRRCERTVHPGRTSAVPAGQVRCRVRLVTSSSVWLRPVE
jgi:catechol 2,3-dioxygenase-like lactoylglutathione lyase family enzyme